MSPLLESYVAIKDTEGPCGICKKGAINAEERLGAP